MNKKITIKKADGSLEFFESQKLIGSLQKAGATKDMVNDVLKQIEKEIQDGMKTSYIYHRAFKILRVKSEPVASKYSLKRALMELGPSGFPFEALVSEIFEKKGYKTQLDVMIKGHCVEHEIDIVAENEKEFLVCEAKFHNNSGIKSDLKVALYVDARCRDLIKGNFGGRKKENQSAQFWVITNTKFTKNAILYGKCTGLNMVGWSYPRNGSLQDLIEETELHPITVLINLTNQEKRALFDRKIVLCKDLIEDRRILESIGVKEQRIDRIINEAARVLKTKSFK